MQKSIAGRNGIIGAAVPCPSEMQELIDLHQLERDLEGVRLLPNLERIHKFIYSLPYQDKYVFISSLNQALVSIMLLQKHTKKCMWMLMDLYSRHGFPVEMGWSQVVPLDGYLKDEWMWNEMKRLCAFVLVDDEFKELVKKVRVEVQEIKRQHQVQMDTGPYDKLMETIRRGRL